MYGESMKSISTCLMFVRDQAGKTEEAITLYASLFERAAILSVERYGADENEIDGSVKLAKFSLNDVEFMAMDSRLDHQFTFTPSVSLFVEYESSVEIERVFKVLSDNGKELMPLAEYGFSQRFGWLNDRYGLFWQLNLAWP